jgi:two-component system response regulator VicR
MQFARVWPLRKPWTSSNGKAFSLPDLRQRVREALSHGASAEQFLCYLDLCIDPHGRRVWVGAREKNLTRQEFDLLAYLFKRKGGTVSWQELLEQVWGYDDPPKERMSIVRSCIHRLRGKIEDDPRHPRYIVNRWGEGYRLGE